ncbi:hybrid sensor histidine kinase/response regulator [Vibrio lentus]|uniref:ATP-binding protein n=1 Tax=Vibrio lentus TaxID=136468 RepID=UPI000C815AF1|nr:ATP-binding protein [Vibrio lentus]MCC4818578.1 response regulator [Vibrio lentus]PMG68651.1 hybrid sensor histidine kinase/response regulator [Vibrio lentus]PMK89642.1 hybrid sensor histidine kinase/response regulator [Vibrio lentus]PML27093.1 hybrid sensor histidine kinase/response regulator [Vibrio lentus]PMM25803.1 hybrid sensor histidine kinase/response regulator [Vibrio lentus]
MNKIRLIFLLFISLFVGLVSFIMLTYFEHEKVTKYGESVRELGHEVLEMRDQITNAALAGISNPYQMTANLVTLEKELQLLKGSYQGTNIHSVFFRGLQTPELLERFHTASIANVDTLDNLVGLSVARQFILQSLTLQLTETGSRNGSHNIDAITSSNINVQSELLASVLFAGTQIQHQGINSDLANLSKTFTELNEQQSQLLSRVLSVHSMEYLEQIEHQFTDVQDQLKSIIVKLIITLALLTFAFSFTLFILRVFELKRNNLSYQEAADKAEKANEAKSLFLATMSHELRTPMNGVLGIAQIIKEDSQSADTRKQAQIIIDSGQHLVTILNDILDFSKVEQGKMELEYSPFSVKDVVTHLDKTLTPLATDKGLDFVIKDSIPANVQLVGDPARTRQILFNLAGNAVKFTESGKVEVEFLIAPTTPPSVNILVTDTGIGIAEDKIDHIFTAFEQAELSTTRKFGGTGLGLSIVKQLVELMDGSIVVTSRLNAGTQFSLSLPLEIKELATTIEEKVESKLKTTLEDFTVLLVEDNKINAMVIRKFCESINLTVENAYDGLQALDKLASNQYDLIIMDNHMPNMSGIEAIQKIRNELKLTTVVFACTADVFKEAHDEFILSGADFVLTKPLQKNSLQNAINEFHHQFEVNRHNSANVHNRPNKDESNITILTRLPKNKLPLTEEEVSRSLLLTSGKMETGEKLECLTSLVEELENEIDELIELFSSARPDDLCRTLNAVRAIASRFEMTEVLELAVSAEQVTEHHTMPEAELLQQLINRLMVNSHQATRLIQKLNQQANTTGNEASK